MTITFPDVSHYQSGLSLAGAVAVIAKASQGISYVDPSYAGFRAQAVRAGIPFAAYHWVDTSDVAAQAHHASHIAGSTPLMWDAEAAGSTVPRLVELTTRLRALGGNPRLVYLPHWWWEGHIGKPDLRPLTAAGLALVSSSYTSYSDTGPGWLPYGGVTPTIWQYTSSQPFNGMRVDFNAYRGTVDQLRALFEGDDMSDLTLNAIDERVATLLRGEPTATIDTGHGIEPETNALQATLVRIEAKLEQLLAREPGEGGGLAPHTHPVGETGPAQAG